MSLNVVVGVGVGVRLFALFYWLFVSVIDFRACLLYYAFVLCGPRPGSHSYKYVAFKFNGTKGHVIRAMMN